MAWDPKGSRTCSALPNPDPNPHPNPKPERKPEPKPKPKPKPKPSPNPNPNQDLLGSILFIYGSELVVDWIKPAPTLALALTLTLTPPPPPPLPPPCLYSHRHAFVVKFNHISPTVCSRPTNPYP